MSIDASSSGPLSMLTEGATSVRRGIALMAICVFATALSALSTWSWGNGWFWHLLLVESAFAAAIYGVLHASLAAKRWVPVD